MTLTRLKLTSTNQTKVPIYYEVSEVGNFTVSLYAVSDLQIKGDVATINAQLDLDPPTGLTLNSGTDYLIKKFRRHNQLTYIC